MSDGPVDIASPEALYVYLEQGIMGPRLRY